MNKVSFATFVGLISKRIMGNNKLVDVMMNTHKWIRMNLMIYERQLYVVLDTRPTNTTFCYYRVCVCVCTSNFYFSRRTYALHKNIKGRVTIFFAMHKSVNVLSFVQLMKRIHTNVCHLKKILMQTEIIQG